MRMCTIFDLNMRNTSNPDYIKPTVQSVHVQVNTPFATLWTSLDILAGRVAMTSTEFLQT